MSKKETVALELATREQLLEFATKDQNLDIHHRSGKDTIIQMLRASGFVASTIEVSVAKVDEIDIKKGEKKVEITLHADPKAKTQRDQFIGYNGRSFLIKRGERVKIPRGVYDVIDNAKTLLYPTDDNGIIIGDPVEVHRFPHTVHSGV